MKLSNKIIQLLIIALNGAFIGTMILIAIVLVPFWKAMQPQEFLDWFSNYGDKIGSLMIPLGPGVLILAIIALIMDKKSKTLWGLTALFTLANFLYFPVYYLPTNGSFAEQTIAINEVSTELVSWLKYHWQRTFFAILALASSILAVSKTMNFVT
jgi:hypothetical protein